ncbi:MAG: CaiB/BaiF CoA transferase family protein [Pigmentiphaga sp.]
MAKFSDYDSSASDDAPGAGGPLAGVRVVDLTSVLLGPFATLHLGDLGADIIKVESPEGDVMRYAGPFRHKGMSPIFLNVNRNKRSVVLDLKTEAGHEALLKLLETADVFLHNLRPKAIRALRLGYRDLADVNPRLIYCTAIGFGRGGRFRDDAAYDDVVQGASGLVAAQAELTGSPGYVATAVSDKTAGMAVALAIASALFSRERTGEGQEIEVPMFEVMVANVMAEHLYGHTFDPPLGPAIYPRQTATYRTPYQTRDGHVSIMVYNDKQWRAFFALIGRPELMDDPRFDSINSRTEHIDEAYQMVRDAVGDRTTEECLRVFGGASIPVCAVNTPTDLLEHPHLTDVQMFRRVEHPTEGTLIDVKSPYWFSRTPVVNRRFAPRLGEHTAEVLEEVAIQPTHRAYVLEDADD